MPDGIHEGSPADTQFEARPEQNGWGVNSKSGGSRRKINSKASEVQPSRDHDSWVESRILGAKTDNFGIRHKADKKPEKLITDATPKAKLEKKKKLNFFDTWKPGDVIPITAPGTRLRLCNFGPEPSKAKSPIVKPPEKYILNGKEVSAKGVLGMTIGDDSKYPNLLLRIARSRGIPFDEEGRLRCPDETPGGGQFTDLQMSNCMIPSARTVAGGAARAVRVAVTPNGISIGQSNSGVEKLPDIEIGARQADSGNRLLYGMKEAIARARAVSIAAKDRRTAVRKAVGVRSRLTGRRSLVSTRQMKIAMKEVFPNLKQEHVDKLFDLPVEWFPTPKAAIEYAQWRNGFIESFLLEGLDNPEAAKSLGYVSLIEAFPEGDADRDSVAKVLVHPSGLAELVVAPVNLRATYEGQLKYGNFTAAGPIENMQTYGHSVGVHEFGHLADFDKSLKDLGVTLRETEMIEETTGESIKLMAYDFSAVPDVASLVQQIQATTDPDQREILEGQVFSVIADLVSEKSFEANKAVDAIGSIYGNENGIEGAAEFFTMYRLLYSFFQDVDPAVLNNLDVDELFAELFTTSRTRPTGGGRYAELRERKLNRLKRRTGSRISNYLESERRREANRPPRNRPIDNYVSDIAPSVSRSDGRSPEFYATTPQNPKQRGPQLPVSELDAAERQVLAKESASMLSQLKALFRQRLNIAPNDELKVDDILDELNLLAGTDPVSYGVWRAELHNMVILDRMMSTGELRLINDVKPYTRTEIFRNMGITVRTPTKTFEDEELDTKAMPRRMRRIGRVLTARFNPRAEDGDGDGLIQDGTQFERPVNPVQNIQKPTPEATPKSSEKEPERPKLTTYEEVKEITRKISDAISDFVPNWTIVKNRRVKQTPSMSPQAVRDYIDDTVNKVERRFGPIKTYGQARNALKSIFKSLDTDEWGGDRDEIMPEQERMVFIGLLSTLPDVPHLKNWNLRLVRNPGGVNASTAIGEFGPRGWDDDVPDTSTSMGEQWIQLEMPWDDVALRSIRGDELAIDPATMSMVAVPNHKAVLDSVGVQMAKALYSSGKSTTSKNEKIIINRDAQNAMALSAMHHEVGHVWSETMSWEDVSRRFTSIDDRDNDVLAKTIPNAELIAKEAYYKIVSRLVSLLISYSMAAPNEEQRMLNYIKQEQTDKLTYQNRIAGIDATLPTVTDPVQKASLTKMRQGLENDIAAIDSRDQMIQELLKELRIKATVGQTLLNSTAVFLTGAVPFPFFHPAYGLDTLDGEFKNTGNKEVLDAVMELMSSPEFINDLRGLDMYQDAFSNDPIKNVRLRPSGGYDFDFDVAAVYDSDNQPAASALMSLVGDYLRMSVWDGVSDPVDRQQLLDFVKLFSYYGSKKPNYALASAIDNVEPQELIAESFLLLVSGFGIEDYQMPYGVQQTLIKLLDWGYGSRAWLDVIHPKSRKVLGF